ncbi:hypothetical protein D9758_011532 [Tetrapyrgos nigripes]|uniref:Uncharacterized protein n=1 Tax=Tetrapyrgos nigripes TaxID=182062 RepID=A0A8H5FRS3_9AGAR|nr:hypothetical protein D9758_011532 [Tetrapyrgos nigripes]
MSARINKLKPRKRNTHRERTVTELTPSVDTSFSTTTTTNNNNLSDIDLAAANSDQLLPAFVAASAASTANLNQPNSMLPGNFGFGFNNFVGPMHSNMQQQQQPFFHPQQQPQPQHNMQSIPPPGQNDLEILENLKETIKKGQHDFYRALPQPQALQSIYLGPSKVPHPEQANGSRDIDQARNADPVSPSRAPTISSSIAHMAVDNVNGPQSAGVKSEPDLHLPVDSKPPVTPARYDPKENLNSSSANTNSVSSADGVAPGSDNMAISAPPPVANGSSPDVRPPGDRNDPPPLSNNHSRYYDPRDRDRDREFRERDNYRDRDWERERDRYRYGRDDPRRLSDARRPDARHYEPEYDPRRRDYDDDRRRLLPPDDRDRFVPRADVPLRPDDRLPPPPRRDDRVDRPYPDERPFARPPLLSDVRPPGPDSRPVADPRDSRDGRAAPNSSAHGPAMDNRSAPLQPALPTSRAAEHPGLPPSESHGTRPTLPTATSATSTEEKSSPIRPPPALEERIGRTPTLQERLNAPPVRPENNGRQPTLEERISQAPVTANQSTGNPRSSAPSTPSDRDRPAARPADGALNGRADSGDASRPLGQPPASNDRSARPLPPGEERGRTMDRVPLRGVTPSRPPAPLTGGPRAPSVARDDPLPARISPNKPDTYRPPPPHDTSRDRHALPPPVRPGANSYRPDDRVYDDRRAHPAPMDIDGPSRYSADPRRFTPPVTGADVYRDRQRRGLTPPPRDHPPYDDRDRRLPPSAGPEREFYERDRRREWTSAAEEEAYWKSRGGYERDRYNRDGHSYPPAPPPASRNAGWEPRGDHERRTSNNPPTSSYPPSAARDPHPPANASLSSRLTDAPPLAEDRDRDRDRPYNGSGNRYAPSIVALSATNAANAPPPPPFPRVRLRSPSPLRPPSKRPRDELYSAPTTTASPYPPPPPPPASSSYNRRPDYVPRGVSPTLPPPPHSHSGPSGGGYYDRDYRRESYNGNGSYERPRSPPRSAYPNNYRPDPRDDRRYMPPPPLPR